MCHRSNTYFWLRYFEHFQRYKTAHFDKHATSLRYIGDFWAQNVSEHAGLRDSVSNESSENVKYPFFWFSRVTYPQKQFSRPLLALSPVCPKPPLWKVHRYMQWRDSLQTPLWNWFHRVRNQVIYGTASAALHLRSDKWRNAGTRVHY